MRPFVSPQPEVVFLPPLHQSLGPIDPTRFLSQGNPASSGDESARRPPAAFLPWVDVDPNVRPSAAFCLHFEPDLVFRQVKSNERDAELSKFVLHVGYRQCFTEYTVLEYLIKYK